MRPSLVFLILIGLSAASAAPKQPSKSRPLSTAEQVASVYREPMGLMSDGTPQLIQAVWNDGKVVWSSDGVNGGPPYFTGNIPAKKAKKILAQFQNDGLFLKSKQRRSYFGPDSDYVTILIRSNGKEFTASSWHELNEQRGSVATTSGISPNGRYRLDTLASEPADYLHFRMLWAETRLAMANIRPVRGNPVNGRIEGHRSKLAWIETAKPR